MSIDGISTTLHYPRSYHLTAPEPPLNPPQQTLLLDPPEPPSNPPAPDSTIRTLDESPIDSPKEPILDFNRISDSDQIDNTPIKIEVPKTPSDSSKDSLEANQKKTQLNRLLFKAVYLNIRYRPSDTPSTNVPSNLPDTGKSEDVDVDPSNSSSSSNANTANKSQKVIEFDLSWFAFSVDVDKKTPINISYINKPPTLNIDTPTVGSTDANLIDAEADDSTGNTKKPEDPLFNVDENKELNFSFLVDEPKEKESKDEVEADSATSNRGVQSSCSVLSQLGALLQRLFSI